ncbi:interaptin-like [Mytilus edulis]|uniref:interaptin-like n=1 Tax=Mytilus edulis TaxID=6550 RepID=UPI0039F1442F
MFSLRIEGKCLVNGIRTAKNEDFELSANEYVNKFRDLKNKVDSKHIDGCPKCTFLDGHTQRYRAERNELREDNQRLENMLTRLTGERNDHGRKLQKLEYENAKLAEKNKSLETHISKNAEEDETLGLKTRSYENTIQNQKKLIFEMQKRDEEQKIALKDAGGAFEQHTLMLERCRTEKNEAESMLSGYLLENDSVKLQCEIAQLQKNFQKQKQKADEQIHNLKKILQEKENDLQQGTKCFNEINEKMKEMEIQGKEMSSSHAEEKKKQIDIENKLQHQVNNLKIQNSIADNKAANAEKEKEEMTSKYNEQQFVFNSKRSQFDREVKDLRIQLEEIRKTTDYRWYSPPEGKSDTAKENISLRSELTEALKNIEKIRQEYTDLSEKYETGMIANKRTIESLQQEKNGFEQENVNFRAKMDQIQSDLNIFKNEQLHQQNSSHGIIENLLQHVQQNRKIDNDRELLRGKIFSLENDKIKLEDTVKKSKQYNQKLQRDQDELQDNVREKANELKESDVRLRKLEADIIVFHNTKTENEQLKKLLREVEGVKKEFDHLEKRINMDV